MSTTVLHVLPDLQPGGGQFVLLWTLEAMAEIDDGSWTHIVLAAGPGPMEENLATVSEVVVGDGLLDGVRRGRQLVAGRSIDLIHCNNTASDRLIGQLVSAAGGPPVVNTVHGVAPARSSWSARRNINRLLARRLAWTIGVSADAADSYADALSLPADRMSIVPGCLPPERFVPPPPAEVAAARGELGAGRSDIVIVSVGRLVPGKGTELLPSVVASLRRRGVPARLVIVGDGPEAAEIGRIARNADIADSVVLTGTRPDVPVILSAADLFVSASTSEGFGLTLLEAMAMGTPVVAYDLPAYHEFTDDGRAVWLVRRDESAAAAESFTAIIERLLSSPEEVGARCETARKLAGAFTAERRAKAHVEIYRSVLS